ncbi:ClpP/crotonase-like domain containing protein [Naviculisporaceae sp. PSN 640]
MASTKYIVVTVNDDTGVALVRLDRPAKRNAFSQAMVDGLVSIFSQLDASSSVRVVLFAGCPDGPFCAGMDISELSQITTPEGHKRRFLKDLTDAFANFSKPIIAAVVGYALGGGFEIALACDMIVAADDAVFGLPEVKIGCIPGAGGTQRLARALGKHRAMELILTGDSITGKELYASGVVNRALPRQDVFAHATKLAERIGSMSGPVTRIAKQAVLTAENSHIVEGMSTERLLYYSTFSLGDFKEGQAAFLEKRPAKFQHY